MSPEILAGKPYTEMADIYSLAMVIYEVLTCTYPFEGYTYINILLILYIYISYGYIRGVQL